MHQSKFEVFIGKDDKYYFHLSAGNGEIICSSQGYHSKDACLKGIYSIRENASKALIVEIEKEKSGQ